jgi:hypothetical protein
VIEWPQLGKALVMIGVAWLAFHYLARFLEAYLDVD